MVVNTFKLASYVEALYIKKNFGANSLLICYKMLILKLLLFSLAI